MEHLIISVLTVFGRQNFHFKVSCAIPSWQSTCTSYQGPGVQWIDRPIKQGPVVQSPIKLILDKWKFNCHLFTVNGGFLIR